MDILNNELFICAAMAVIIFLFTQLLKLPIKHLTVKIQNERTRKIANATILLIPFVLGVLLEFLYKTYVLHVGFSVLTGLGYGAGGVSLYGVIERFFKIKIENPYESEEGEAVLEIVSDATSDGKLTAEDAGNAVTKFLEMTGNKDEVKRA